MIEADHYAVLGLRSGESKRLTKLTEQRRDDPEAHANFLKLQTSYEVLKDVKARNLFDDLLRVKQEKLQRPQDLKRRKMMTDLEERERYADPSAREEERIARKLREEISRIYAQQSKAI